MRETWQFEELPIKVVHLGSVSVTRGKPNSSFDDTAYMLVPGCRSMALCAGVGEARSRTVGMDYDSTHYTVARTDIPSVSTCSILRLQKGGVLLQT